MSSDSYDNFRKILELWEQGKSKVDIAAITEIPIYTVNQCIERFRSVAQLNEATGAGKGESSSKRAYVVKRYGPNQRKYSDSELREAVKTSFSIVETLRKLDLRPAGGNYTILKQRIKDLELDTAHFRGQGWSLGSKSGHTIKMSLEDILVENSTYASTNRLRQRLVEEGYAEHRCVSCGLGEWLNQPIPLELDHINGNRQDNRLENLRLLCPNCHALTPTYRGKNMKVKNN